MTDRELMQQALGAYGYASRLAVALWEQHYKDVAQQWKPLDDLMGVLTQIDNMTSGLTRLAQPETPDVTDYERGYEQGKADALKDFDQVEKVMTAFWNLQRPWVRLTDEEIDHAAEQSDNYASFHGGIRFAEAKLKEKNT